MGAMLGAGIIVPLIALVCCICLPCYLVSSVCCSMQMSKKESFINTSKQILYTHHINPILYTHINSIIPIVLISLIVLLFTYCDDNLIKTYYKQIKYITNVTNSR
jgi:hypothetical protein